MRRIEEAFAFIDEDGSGMIDFQEMRNGLKVLLHERTPYTLNPFLCVCTGCQLGSGILVSIFSSPLFLSGIDASRRSLETKMARLATKRCATPGIM